MEISSRVDIVGGMMSGWWGSACEMCVGVGWWVYCLDGQRISGRNGVGM